MKGESVPVRLVGEKVNCHEVRKAVLRRPQAISSGDALKRVRAASREGLCVACAGALENRCRECPDLPWHRSTDVVGTAQNRHWRKGCDRVGSAGRCRCRSLASLVAACKYTQSREQHHSQNGH